MLSAYGMGLADQAVLKEKAVEAKLGDAALDKALDELARAAREELAGQGVDAAAIRQGLATARVAGRFQRVARAPDVILDVAHNPEAARALASLLREQPVAGRTLAVVGMLADKDAAGVFAALVDQVDAWWACTPDSPRALDASALAAIVGRFAASAPVSVQADVNAALAAARSTARENDRILVFGSFYTVAAVLDHAATQQ